MKNQDKRGNQNAINKAQHSINNNVINKFNSMLKAP